MVVMSDTEDPFVPLPDDLLVNLRESRAVFESLLDALPATFAANSQACCLCQYQLDVELSLLFHAPIFLCRLSRRPLARQRRLLAELACCSGCMCKSSSVHAASSVRATRPMHLSHCGRFPAQSDAANADLNQGHSLILETLN